MYERKFDKLTLVLTIAAGLVVWLIDTVLYRLLQDYLWRPLLIALLFLVCVLLICALILLISKKNTYFEDEFLFLHSGAAVFIGLAVCCVVVFACSMLFEFIYDRESQTVTEATSYIFLIDQSGSMATNDPDFERYSAVEEVLSGQSQDFPYAVYAFSTSLIPLKEMAPISSGPIDWGEPEGSGTAIIRSLTELKDLIDNGNLNMGAHPRVILLSDGYATDTGFFSNEKAICSDYAASGISISTVGLGNSVDTDLMQSIASRTGGVYLHVDNAGQLSPAMLSAATTFAGRDLLSVRIMGSGNALYAFLRILFLFLLGAMITFAKAMACAAYDKTMLILIEGGIASLAAALLMEFLLALGVPLFICHLLFWVLLCATPVFRDIYHHDSGFIYRPDGSTY